MLLDDCNIEVCLDVCQQRLPSTHESKLRHTQYGFRACKGAEHALFILRRAMQWSEMTEIHGISYSWIQALDSVDHSAMINALERLGCRSPNTSYRPCARIQQSPLRICGEKKARQGQDQELDKDAHFVHDLAELRQGN